MNALLRIWGAYVRWAARYPTVHSIVPFIPIVALWAVIAESGVFPRVFLPGPIEVARSFVSLMYKGILPDYLQDSIVRLVVGAATGMAIGIPLGLLVAAPTTRRTMLSCR